MSEGGAPPEPARRSERPAFLWLATFTLVVAIFALGRAVLVPFALSIVLAFALNPAVRRLDHRLGRAVAVAIVVLLALGVVTGFGYLLKRQLDDLSAGMTKYSESILRKMVALRGDETGGLTGLSRSVDKVVREMDTQVVEDRGARPVRVVPAATTAFARIETTLMPVLEPLATSVIVLVMVIFLLGKREDLRDRFVRLAGRGNVTLTTRALDDAGQRISRFITHQSAINAGFGIVIAIGLYCIGIPYAPLWGFVAAVLRFVPFVGTLLAMLLPGLLAFAQFEAWWPMLATLGLFLGLDTVTAYAVEPLVIGAKTGVSSIAMLVSAIFWAWLWGPVGLVLSTPLTVCLAVLGKNVPRLAYLAVLLGDEPALEAELVLYQRLLASDEEEAQEILEKCFGQSPRGQVFDEVVIPALLLTARDRARHEISEADNANVVHMIRALIDSVPQPAAPDKGVAAPAQESATAPPRRVLGVSARSVMDEIIWEMLAQLFDATKVAIESVGSAYLGSEVTAIAEQKAPDLVCVVSIPPGGLAQARYICRRLRTKLPNTPILVIRPGVQGHAKESAQKLTVDGASSIAFTLEEAHATANSLLLLGSVKGGEGQVLGHP